jgi:hypothetical protein
MGRVTTAVAIAMAALLACAAAALAHVERTSYWPDPKPDTSVTPPAGGGVPKARSLASALKAKPPGTTRVVCHRKSLKYARMAIGQARSSGVSYRPTEPRHKITHKQGKRLLTINEKLFKRCKFHEIQPAVTASGNNDRVVIMPGVYMEQTARKVPAFPQECEKYRTDNSDHGAGALSYEYQFHCPNAQALVAVIGRALDTAPPPTSGPNGRPDPHGIPNEGACIRCNVQIEGSGPGPDAVKIDAGRVASGNGAPIDSKKDVTIKADRADGFVLRNVVTRHAAEHDVYVLETDGYLLKNDKYFYAGEYGTLTFASDHGLTHTCDAKGNGDSGVYPGGAPDTGNQRDAGFYPEKRLNQTITHCDSHHNNLGYSGTMGNATHVVDNNFYDNTTGIATDSFYAGGHPGYPQDSAVYENNRIYSNNFNVYAPDSDVKSSVPVPIGVGMLIGGGNDDLLKGNHIYDNWRRGTMLMSVPDAVSCAPNTDGTAPPCTPSAAATTSNGNRYTGNAMSVAPDGTKMPNGTDFWWDEYASNHGNCWPDNKGIDGTPASITSDPPRAAGDATTPGYLAVKDCDSQSNVGIGDSEKESVLAGCAADVQNGSYDTTVCDWFTMPPKPEKGQNGAPPGVPSGLPGAGGGVSGASYPNLCTLVGGLGGTLTCSPFQHRIS